MENVLYIHGFGSNQNSGSFLALKKAFPNQNFISADFDLLDVQGTLEKIDHLCLMNSIHLIIGKSLGAFYALAHEGPELRLVINPCIKPWIEIPKLDSSIDPKVLNEWKELFEKTEENIESQQRIRSFAIFGNEDELFNYKSYFDDKYGGTCASLKKSFYVPGKHHIDIEPLKLGVKKAFNYFCMMGEYNEVFQLMPYYHLVSDPNDNDYFNFSEDEKKYIIDQVNNYHDKVIEYQNDKLFDELN